MSIVTRFAPSPTGLLHAGHAFSALLSWERARRAGGRFLLRIEDIDAARCRPEFTAAILADLAWLGLGWDGPVRVQSAHMAQYRASLDALAARGLLYPCFCTRAEIAEALSAPHALPGRYPGTCRARPRAERAALIAAGAPYALRLDITAARAQCARPPRFFAADAGWVEAEPERLGDAVLARKDTPASYHLCVCHDDALQGVSHVVRGEDLREATHLHALLQALLGWPAPAYEFHKLLTDAAGKRLAKRDRAETLAAMREAGTDPRALTERLRAAANPVSS